MWQPSFCYFSQYCNQIADRSHLREERFPSALVGEVQSITVGREVWQSSLLVS